MLGWLHRKKREKTERRQQLREQRIELTQSLLELGRKRHTIEELMRRMLEVRAEAPASNDEGEERHRA